MSALLDNIMVQTEPLETATFSCQEHSVTSKTMAAVPPPCVCPYRMLKFTDKETSKWQLI